MTGFPAPDRRFSLGSPMPSSGLRACARRLAGSPQPNRVHFLRTALSLPAALHLASRRRSCFQLYTFHVSVERTFTSPIKCACTRTSAGGSPACLCGQMRPGYVRPMRPVRLMRPMRRPRNAIEFQRSGGHRVPLVPLVSLVPVWRPVRQRPMELAPGPVFPSA